MPNFVVWAIRSMLLSALSIASCSASIWSASLPPLLRAKSTDSRMRTSRFETSPSAASAVPSKLEAFSEFSIAWSIAVTWLRSRSEITSPDGSSEARLIRSPVDRRSSDFERARSEAPKVLRATFVELLVLIRKPIVASSSVPPFTQIAAGWWFDYCGLQPSPPPVVLPSSERIRAREIEVCCISTGLPRSIGWWPSSCQVLRRVLGRRRPTLPPERSLLCPAPAR